MSDPLLVPEAILREALEKAYLLGYEAGVQHVSLVGSREYNGQYYLVGEGVMAATTFQSEEDVLEFNRRYAAAPNKEAKRAVIRSVLTFTVKTR